MGGPRVRNNPFLVQRLCTAPQHVIRKQKLKGAQGSRDTCSCTGRHGPSFPRVGGFEGRKDRGPLDDQSPPPSPARPQATPGPRLSGVTVCLVSPPRRQPALGFSSFSSTREQGRPDRIVARTTGQQLTVSPAAPFPKKRSIIDFFNVLDSRQAGQKGWSWFHMAGPRDQAWLSQAGVRSRAWGLRATSGPCPVPQQLCGLSGLRPPLSAGLW